MVSLSSMDETLDCELSAGIPLLGDVSTASVDPLLLPSLSEEMYIDGDCEDVKVRLR